MDAKRLVSACPHEPSMTESGTDRASSPRLSVGEPVNGRQQACKPEGRQQFQSLKEKRAKPTPKVRQLRRNSCARSATETAGRDTGSLIGIRSPVVGPTTSLICNSC